MVAIRKLAKRGRTGVRQHQRKHFSKLRLEALEDRCLPSPVNDWVAPGSSGNWNTSTNWSQSHVPTSTEIATFNGSSAAVCTIDAPATGTNMVSGINIMSGYAGPIEDSAGIVIGSDGFVCLTGGSFAVTGSGNLDLEGPNTTVTGGETLSISARITGTGGFNVGQPRGSFGWLILSGDNTYTGTTLVDAGNLEVTGTVANSPVIINRGAALLGTANGFIASLTFNGSNLDALGPGILTVGSLQLHSGNSGFDNSVTMNFVVNGLNPGTDYFQVRVNGTIDLGNEVAQVNVNTNNSFKARPGDMFDLIENLGGNPITGFFSGLPEGGLDETSPIFAKLLVTYQGGAGNDFVLTAFHPSNIVGRVSSTGQWWIGQSGGSSFNNFPATTWSPAVTWVDVQTGDFTGNGFQDIVGRVEETGQWWVAVSNGFGGFSNSLWGSWSPAVTWVDVKVGDFDGDGKMDIVGRVQETGQWWVAQSTGSSFTNSLWATWSPAATWVDVQVGDFHGDGKADIAGRYLQGGQWWVGVSTGSDFNTSLWDIWNPNVAWVDVQVGDFDGDGKADIIGRTLEGGAWWTGISTGSSFNTSLWDIWSPDVTWVDVKVGDFNGDGKADITGRVLDSGQWWTGISTGSAFATALWDSWSPAVTWVDVQVGDFNGDGKADITGRVLESGQWWTGVNTGSSFTTTLWGQWSPAVTWVDVQNGSYV